jgi:hypothetical protein
MVASKKRARRAFAGRAELGGKAPGVGATQAQYDSQRGSGDVGHIPEASGAGRGQNKYAIATTRTLPTVTNKISIRENIRNALLGGERPRGDSPSARWFWRPLGLRLRLKFRRQQEQLIRFPCGRISKLKIWLKLARGNDWPRAVLAEAVIRSVELRVQPGAHDVVRGVVTFHGVGG